MEALPSIAVVLSGLLTGSELTSWAIVHPTLWKLEDREQIHAEKLMYQRFGTVDPFLQPAATAACFIAARGLRGRRAVLANLAGAGYTAMVAITLTGNMPINLRVFRWDEQRGDVSEWRALRRRWDRFHRARIALDSAAFVLMTLAAAGA